jgi:hypothetical protein
MALYPSAEALLADVALRLDQFGLRDGILVVEGPDDKRLLCTRTRHRQQVLASGGRRLLLSAHSLAVAHKTEGVVFLTDCDYEVKLGTLSPTFDLIVTKHADLECDLLDEGGFTGIVLQIVPAALNSDEDLARISLSAQDRAVAVAEVLGRIRQVAKAAGFPVDTEIRHHKYRRKDTADVDERKLVRAVVQASPECPLRPEEMEERVHEIPRGYDNCNGHDLISALNHVLRDDFGVRDQTPESMQLLLRAGVSEKMFAQLDFVVRLKKWQDRVSRKILA